MKKEVLMAIFAATIFVGTASSTALASGREDFRGIENSSKLMGVANLKIGRIYAESGTIKRENGILSINVYNFYDFPDENSRDASGMRIHVDCKKNMTQLEIIKGRRASDGIWQYVEDGSYFDVWKDVYPGSWQEMVMNNLCANN